jgi:hypothetical protein
MRLAQYFFTYVYLYLIVSIIDYCQCVNYIVKYKTFLMKRV